MDGEGQRRTVPPLAFTNHRQTFVKEIDSEEARTKVAMHRILYVDGFNFYYGVTRYWHENKGLAGLGWCDFSALMQRNFPAPGRLSVKYFTAPVFPNVELKQGKKGEHERYALWRRAVETIKELEIVEGFYKRDDDAERPDGRPKARTEKQTDVNLAVEMLTDAFSAHDRPQHVFLLSGDFDRMPAVFAAHERAPVPIDVTVLLPSNIEARHWVARYDETRKRLRRQVPSRKFAGPGRRVDVLALNESMLAKSLLPYTLIDAKGEKFDCPPYWRLSADYLEKQCANSSWRPDLNGIRPV